MSATRQTAYTSPPRVSSSCSKLQAVQNPYGRQLLWPYRQHQGLTSCSWGLQLHNMLFMHVPASWLLQLMPPASCGCCSLY